MEWNSYKAGVSLQEIETDKDMDTESLCNSFESGSSSRNTAASLPLSNKLDKNFIGMEKISGRPGELGKQKVYGSASYTATKRSRASYHKLQNPSCQVEGCYLDLSLAKDYHRRHRICEIHSKSPKVIVAGMERRFCQQCSRFHGLSEFDDKREAAEGASLITMPDVVGRSLSLSISAQQDCLLHYMRTSQNVLLNILPISLSNRTGENICNSTLTQAGDSLVRPPSKTGGNYRRSCLLNDEIPSAAYNIHVEPERSFSLQSRNPRVLDQYLPSASSLLSIDDHWSLNRDESTSMEGLMHRNARVDNPNWSSNHGRVAADEGPPVSPVHSTNLHHSGSSLLQEFDLFKTQYDSGCFHSNDQRNL